MGPGMDSSVCLPKMSRENCESGSDMEVYPIYTDVRKITPRFEITQNTVTFSVSLKVQKNKAVTTTLK